jgi:hypothetical protein
MLAVFIEKLRATSGKMLLRDMWLRRHDIYSS